MKITKDLKKLLIEYTIDHPKKFRKFVKVEYLFTNYEMVYKKLCENRNPEAIKLIEKNIIAHKKYDMIDWSTLSGNHSAISLLESILDQYPEKIDWKTLSSNPKAIHILEKNPDKIVWPGYHVMKWQCIY